MRRRAINFFELTALFQSALSKKEDSRVTRRSVKCVSSFRTDPATLRVEMERASKSFLVHGAQIPQLLHDGKIRRDVLAPLLAQNKHLLGIGRRTDDECGEAGHVA